MMKTDDINDQAITKDKIRDGNVTAEKLADGAVSTDKLPDGAIKTPKIADENITTSKLAEASVVTSKIADQNVTNEKIADHSVDNRVLAIDAVTYDKLKDKSVITEKLNDRAVTTEKVEENAITNTKLGDQSVDGRVVREASIEGKHIGNNAVSTSKIASRSVTNEKIAYNSVSRAELTPDVRSSIDKKADAEQVNNSLYDLEKKIGERFVVEGDVTNLPDEEDLTSVKESERDVLKIADRSYAPEKFSGKGYKILRRNIKPVSIAVTKIRVESVPSSDGILSLTINGKETQVAVSATTDKTTALVAQKVAAALQDSMTEYDVSIDASLITLTRKSGGSVTPSVFSASTTGVVCTITDSTEIKFRNILTQDMINQANTIYVIRYDFTLGEDITVPANCVLDFDGGSISGAYTIIGANTGINASLVKIFNTDVTLASSWNVPEAYPEWFGAKGDGVTDDTNTILKSVLYFNSINLTKHYLISSTININRYISLYSKTSGGFVVKTDIDVLYLNSVCLLNSFIIDLYKDYDNHSAIIISKDTTDYYVNYSRLRGIIENIKIIKDFKIHLNNSIGITLFDEEKKGVYNWSILNCIISFLDIGILFYAKNGYINSNTVKNTFISGARIAVKCSVENEQESQIIDNKILNCSFQNSNDNYQNLKKSVFDVPISNRIINNIFDIFVWDIEKLPNTLGSCIGGIGRNRFVKSRLDAYNTNRDTAIFIGALQKDTLFKDSFVKMKLHSTSYDYEIFLRGENAPIIDIFNQTPLVTVDALSLNDILADIYYMEYDNVFYLYLKADGGSYFIEILDCIGYIYPDMALNPPINVSDFSSLTRLGNSILTKGKTAHKVSPFDNIHYKGFEYFDTTLGKPILWNGSAWVDATGTQV